MRRTHQAPAAAALRGVVLPELAATPGHLVRRAEQVHTALWSAEVSGGLTVAQYAVLLVLGTRPGTDQRSVGDHASLDKSTAAAVLARLVRQGLAGAVRDPRDGRRKLVELTPAGWQTLTEVTPPVVRVQQRVLTPLPEPDRPRLVELFTSITRAHPQGGPTTPAAPASRGGAATPAGEPGLPDLAALPGHLIRRAQQVKTALWLEVVGAELTSPQFAALLEVARTPGVDQQTVAARASLDKATMTDVIVRLERRGLVIRVRDRWDRRRSVLEPTEAGARALAAVLPAVAAMNRRLLAPMTAAEQQEWTRLCRRLVFRA